MSSTIFVGNLPLGTSARSLAEFFQDLGNIVKCEIPPPKDNYKTIFGFVEFTDTYSAKSAVEVMNDKEMNGNILKIAYANSRHSNSSHTPPISRGSSRQNLAQDQSYSRYEAPQEHSSYDSRYNDSRRRYGSRSSDYRPNYRSEQEFRPERPSYRSRSPIYRPQSPNHSPVEPNYSPPEPIYSRAESRHDGYRPYDSRGRGRGRGRGGYTRDCNDRYNNPGYSNRHDRSIHADRASYNRSPRRNYGYDGRHYR